MQFGFGLKTICEPRHHWRPRFDDAVAEMREQSRIVFELGEVDRYFDSGANLVVAQPIPKVLQPELTIALGQPGI